MVNQRNSDMVADTLANVDKTLFYKFNANEMYPDHVLIYRDLVRKEKSIIKQGVFDKL
jgi:hypothetical protein